MRENSTQNLFVCGLWIGLLVVTGISAQGCNGTIERDGCSTSRDCADGTVCLARVCVDAGADSDGSEAPAPYCGDGKIDEGEQCDDGALNSDRRPDSCRRDCTLPACGDGVVDTDEACDNGDGNGDDETATCLSDCTLPTLPCAEDPEALCGDSCCVAGEICDDTETCVPEETHSCEVDEITCGDSCCVAGEICDDTETCVPEETP